MTGYQVWRCQGAGLPNGVSKQKLTESAATELGMHAAAKTGHRKTFLPAAQHQVADHLCPGAREIEAIARPALTPTKRVGELGR